LIPSTSLRERRDWNAEENLKRKSGTILPKELACFSIPQKPSRAIVEKNSPAAEGDDETFEAVEGRILARVHLARERNRKLVDQKKSAAIKRAGKLTCEVCLFDFEAAYGERGAGFIEVHHLKPIHTLLPGEKTKLEELALLLKLPPHDTCS
jgi:predicted HNH restriction endonuclease